MRDWPTKTLGELADVVTKGTTPTSVGFKFAEAGINFVKVESIRGDGSFIPQKFAFIDEDCHSALKRSQLADGDILFSIAGALGRSALVTKDILPANTNQALSIIRLKLSESILPSFVIKALSSGMLIKQVEKQRGGVAQQNLSLAQVKGFTIPLPSLPEQERIVAILDEAFEGIGQAVKNAEKNLANVRELFESYLNSVFTQKGEGWVELHLKDVCLVFGRGKSKHRPRNDPKLYGGPYPFIQTGDINNANHIIGSYSQTYSDVGLKQSKMWSKGTICLAIVGATIGETGILGFDACFPDSVIGMVVDPDKADEHFLEYMLQYFKKTIKKKGKGSARNNINLGTFQNQKFPIPPLNAQKEIVLKIGRLAEDTKYLEAIYQQKLTALAELKQSLLQKAFAGELTAEDAAIRKEAAA